MQSFREGEEKGFTWFFKYHYRSLCFFANRFVKDQDTAEEIVQESFIKIWERRDMFDNAGAIKSYLYKIVRNAAIDFLRHQKFVADAEQELEYLSNVETNAFMNEQFITTEVLNDIYTMINALPFQCRRIFTLFYLQGKDLHHIARELNLSINTVKAQKARGLLILRRHFSSV